MDFQTSPEWYEFIASFRLAPESKRSGTLLGNTLDQLLDKFVKVLTGNRDEVLRINILVLLQEYIVYFVSDGNDIRSVSKPRLLCLLQCLCQLRKHPIEPSVGMSYQLMSQVLVTLTAVYLQIRISVEIFDFDSHINALLALISAVNGSADRFLRGMACDCLRECEENFPGLLSSHVNELLQWARTENTHVHQNYAVLYACVLRNAALCHREELHMSPSPSSLSAVDGGRSGKGDDDVRGVDNSHSSSSHSYRSNDSSNFPSGGTSLGGTIIGTGAGAGAGSKRGSSEQVSAAPSLPDALVKEYKRGGSFIIENFSVMNPLAIGLCTPLLQDCFSSIGFPDSLFKVHYIKYAQSLDLVLVHHVLALSMKMKHVFSVADRSALFRRLLYGAASPTTPLSQRLLSLNLVAEAGAAALEEDPTLLTVYTHWLFPWVYENVSMSAGRLDCIGRLFFSGNAPPSLLRLLSCFSDYHASGPESPEALAYFRTVGRLLVACPALHHDVAALLCSILIEKPTFVQRVVDLLETPGLQQVQLLLGALSGTVLSEEALHRVEDSLLAYTPLLARVASCPDIDARILLDKLKRVVRRLNVTVRTVDAWGVLDVCRCVMAAHATAHILNGVGEILSYLSQVHPNIAIRDESQHLLLLLNHVHDEGLVRLLSGHLSVTDARTVAMDMAPVVFNTQVTVLPTVSPFLALKRRENPIFAPVENAALPEMDASPGEVTVAGSPSEQQQQQRHVAVDGEDEEEESMSPLKALLVHTSLSQVAGEYASFLRDANCSHIKLEFSLAFSSPLPRLPFGGVMDPDIISKVFGLTLRFLTPRPLAAIPAVTIPYLARHELPITSHLAYPHRYLLTLSIRPLDPLPCTVDVEVDFTDHQGRNGTMSLQPISVLFSDLFLSLPVPHSMLQRGLSDYVARIAVFESLWQNMEVGATGVREGVSEWMESVKFLSVPRPRMKALLAKNLRPFAVGQLHRRLESVDETWNSSRRECFWLGIFLAPSYHLLLKFYPSADSTTIRIRTDYWQSMLYIDDFFEQLLRETKKN